MRQRAAMLGYLGRVRELLEFLEENDPGSYKSQPILIPILSCNFPPFKFPESLTPPAKPLRPHASLDLRLPWWLSIFPIMPFPLLILFVGCEVNDASVSSSFAVVCCHIPTVAGFAIPAKPAVIASGVCECQLKIPQ